MSPRRVSLGRDPAELADVRVVSGDGAAPLDRVVERLCDEALAHGLAEGIARAQHAAAQTLGEASEQLAARAQEAADSVAKTAVVLAVEIARHLVRAEVDAGRHDIERIVRETLAAGGVGRAECVVHIHPDDAAALAGVTFRSGTRIEPDVGIGRGEVQVETANGLLVRDFDEAFKEIRRRMLSHVGDAG